MRESHVTVLALYFLLCAYLCGVGVGGDVSVGDGAGGSEAAAAATDCLPYRFCFF